jgi:hypothetical protein
MFILSFQTKLVDTAESIQNKLSYFNELDKISSVSISFSAGVMGSHGSSPKLVIFNFFSEEQHGLLIKVSEGVRGLIPVNDLICYLGQVTLLPSLLDEILNHNHPVHPSVYSRASQNYGT